MPVPDGCRLVDQAIRGQSADAQTSHFRVEVDGQAVFDRHYRGPRVADVFSVTKSVVATLAGIAVAEGRLDDLDLPVGRALPSLAGTPAAGQTLRQLLTMTRGAETEGPFEIDEVMARPDGWLERIAAAPQLDPPGSRFRYDNGGAHLLGAALSALVGMPLSASAEGRLFGPLGIGEWHWPRDPDGYDYGAGHLRLAAADLAKLGRLWLDGGRWRGRQLLDTGFAAEMATAHNRGGPPEDHPSATCSGWRPTACSPPAGPGSWWPPSRPPGRWWWSPATPVSTPGHRPPTSSHPAGGRPASWSPSTCSRPSSRPHEPALGPGGDGPRPGGPAPRDHVDGRHLVAGRPRPGARGPRVHPGRRDRCRRPPGPRRPPAAGPPGARGQPGLGRRGRRARGRRHRRRRHGRPGRRPPGRARLGPAGDGGRRPGPAAGAGRGGRGGARRGRGSALYGPDREAVRALLPPDRFVVLDGGHCLHRDLLGRWLEVVGAFADTVLGAGPTGQPGPGSSSG
ncbi:MAG TPA: serine hydrolase [Actinomycetes bacterium]|nr:serine hydrolase [Actinomycetes bacterium]